MIREKAVRRSDPVFFPAFIRINPCVSVCIRGSIFPNLLNNVANSAGNLSGAGIEQANVQNLEMSTNKLEMKTILKIPTLFGESDVIRSLLLYRVHFAIS